MFLLMIDSKSQGILTIRLGHEVLVWNDVYDSAIGASDVHGTRSVYNV